MISKELNKVQNEVKKSNEKTHDYDLTISKSKYPETAGHIGDAIKAGNPDVVTINRGGASSNRRASLKGVDTRAGKDRDEWRIIADT